ncbi:hypothetical protein IFM89_009519 [Coptis chinensis]|uniref:Uncharacterized protein n=1 Tax=Coptis chinensis TaxID=261450 RepID=A0A835HWU0_9MAGN|nr:hypothetical protein IFM89_009519 [Coptis chinensis]
MGYQRGDIYYREFVESRVMSAIPQGIGREKWIQTIPSVGCRFCKDWRNFGTTATLVVIDVDHRLEENVEKRERLPLVGEVGRLNVYDSNKVGPLLFGPGGLCLSW